MTDARTTQIAVEQWSDGNPAAQISQVVIEQWAAFAVTGARAVVSFVALEQWASVIPAAPAFRKPLAYVIS